MAQPRVVGMERQRDERLKAAGLVLQLAQPHQVVDAVVIVLDVAVEHRAVRAQAQFMRGAMDVEPLAASALCSQMRLAHFRMKDLRAAAGHAAQAGAGQVLEDLAHGPPREMLKPVDLDRRPGLQVQCG